MKTLKPKIEAADNPLQRAVVSFVNHIKMPGGYRIKSIGTDGHTVELAYYFGRFQITLDVNYDPENKLLEAMFHVNLIERGLHNPNVFGIIEEDDESNTVEVEESEEDFFKALKTLWGKAKNERKAALKDATIIATIMR